MNMHPHLHTLHHAMAQEQQEWQARLAATSHHQRRATRDTDPSFFTPLEDTRRTEAVTESHSCPFDGRVSVTDSGTIFQFTQPGALSPAGLPTNMFSGSSLWSTPVGGGTTYILLRCFTSGNQVTSCQLVSSGSPADVIGIQEETAPAMFEVTLWVILGGTTAFKVVGCGILQATPQVAVVTEKEDPVCAGDPLVRHYTWIITEGGS